MPKRNSNIGEIRIKLEGENVKNHAIDAEELGNFLLNFQSIVTKFSQLNPTTKKIFNREIRTKSRLYLKKLEKGSVDLIFGATPQAQLNEQNKLQETYNNVVSLTEMINKNPNKARESLSKRFEDPRRRLEVEQKIRYLFTDKLTVGFLKERDKFITLNHSRAVIIADWLKEDYKESTSTIRGIILRLKGDGARRYFTVKTDENKIVKCYYHPELEPVLSQDFKKQPVVISGLMGQKVKGLNIERILDLQPWKQVSLDALGKFKFKKHLLFNIEFEDDAWFLSSADFNTVGSGKSYQEALRDFEDNLDDTMELYTKVIKPEKMTEKAKLLREKLHELVSVTGLR